MELCAKMVELQSAFYVYEQAYWRVYIYDNFSSNKGMNYNDIWKSFEEDSKKVFIARWEVQYNSSLPIEHWYISCRGHYCTYLTACELLESTNQLMEDITC